MIAFVKKHRRRSKSASLDLLTEAGDEVGGTVVARHRVPWLEAIQWLGEHRI